MPPLSPQLSSGYGSDKETEDMNNNVIDSKVKSPSSEVSNMDTDINCGSYIIKNYTKKNVRYIYNTSGQTIVWRNVFLFFALHIIYLYSYYVCLANKCWYTWIFG